MIILISTDVTVVVINLDFCTFLSFCLTFFLTFSLCPALSLLSSRFISLHLSRSNYFPSSLIFLFFLSSHLSFLLTLPSFFFSYPLIFLFFLLSHLSFSYSLIFLFFYSLIFLFFLLSHLSFFLPSHLFFFLLSHLSFFLTLSSSFFSYPLILNVLVKCLEGLWTVPVISSSHGNKYQINGIMVDFCAE